MDTAVADLILVLVELAALTSSLLDSSVTRSSVLEPVELNVLSPFTSISSEVDCFWLLSS